MTMKLFLLVFVVIFSSSLLTAQNSKWTHTDFTLQSRLLNNSSNLETVLDLSIGTEWNYLITNSLSVNLGVALNYGHFKSSKLSSDELLYVSYFKGTRIDYFYHQEVTQFSLETPISLQFDFFQPKSNKFSLVGGVTPQFLLYSNSKGNGLRGTRKVTTSITDGDLAFSKDEGNIDGRSHYILNDLNLNLGLIMEHQMNNEKAIIFGAGFQYSTNSHSTGMYLKTGFRF